MGWVVRNGSGYFITRNSLLPQIHKIAFFTFTSSSFHRTSKNPSHGNLIAVVVCPLFCRRRRLSLVPSPSPSVPCSVAVAVCPLSIAVTLCFCPLLLCFVRHRLRHTPIPCFHFHSVSVVLFISFICCFVSVDVSFVCPSAQ
jgi:hypothetical protein